MGRSHDSTRFDEPDETLQGIIDGTVHGTVVQDPFEYGYQAVKVRLGR